jgi:hypothetical protein
MLAADLLDAHRRGIAALRDGAHADVVTVCSRTAALRREPMSTETSTRRRSGAAARTAP